LRLIKGFERIRAPMTIEQFSRQTYLYPVLWYIFATIVAFVAAMLFWQRGSSSAEGKVPGLPVTWKFTGAGAVFVVVIFLFWFINPLKSFSDYRKIVIVNSNADVASPAGPFVLHKITPEDISKDSVGFDDPASLQVELIPFDFVYALQRSFHENSLVTASPIPKGTYRMRITYLTVGDPMKRLMIILLTILSISDLVLATSIKGKITQQGAVATKALVIFNSNGVEKARAITGDDGLYYVPNLPDGTYNVKIVYREITKDYPAIAVPGGKYDFEL
jgi:hypothetical protein